MIFFGSNFEHSSVSAMQQTQFSEFPSWLRSVANMTEFWAPLLSAPWTFFALNNHVPQLAVELCCSSTTCTLFSRDTFAKLIGSKWRLHSILEQVSSHSALAKNAGFSAQSFWCNSPRSELAYPWHELATFWHQPNASGTMLLQRNPWQISEYMWPQHLKCQLTSTCYGRW